MGERTDRSKFIRCFPFYERLVETLSLYARQYAWLNTAPKGSKLSRVESLRKNAKEGENADDTLETMLPDIPEGAEYLVSYFVSTGCVMHTGMGSIPLSWQEIKAWAWANGLEDTLDVMEAEAIRKMSMAYAAEHSQADDPKRPQPYVRAKDAEEIDRTQVSNKVRNILAGFKKNKGK